MSDPRDPFREPAVRYGVRRCARCGGDHDEPLTFYPLDRPNEAWTHYAMCPANGQPIMLRTQGGHHRDDPIMLHSLAAVAAEVPPAEQPAAMMAPPALSVVDQVANVVGWQGKGSLANHVERIVKLHRPEVLSKIVRAVQGEALRLNAAGVEHNLDSVALALLNYRDGE